MKKLFSLISTMTLITTGITPVISCGTSKKPVATYSDVTKEQETIALINFAEKNNITDINLSTINFVNSPQSNDQQSIRWDFATRNNSTLADHTQLLGQYRGMMLYNNKTKTFTLETKPVNPFAKPANYIPGYYDSSFDIGSYITGNNNDFTIVAAADALEALSDEIMRDPMQPLGFIFLFMRWKNLSQFSGLTTQDLANLNISPTKWKIPEHYFAVIHVQKNAQTQNQYQIVWSNLVTNADRESLPSSSSMAQGYTINSFFWKQTSSDFHLWSSHEFLLELTQLYQLDKNPNNPWFTSTNLQKLFKQTPATVGGTAGTINFATVPKSDTTPAGYQAFNASETELISAIQSLIKTSDSFQTFSTFVANNYRNNNLTFTYQNNTFTFDPSQSGELALV